MYERTRSRQRGLSRASSEKSGKIKLVTHCSDKEAQKFSSKTLNERYTHHWRDHGVDDKRQARQDLRSSGMTPCTSVPPYQTFGKICWLHFQGRRVSYHEEAGSRILPKTLVHMHLTCRIKVDGNTGITRLTIVSGANTAIVKENYR